MTPEYFRVVDVETVCDVASCAGFNTGKCEEKHALSPWHSRITQVGVMGFRKGKPHNWRVLQGNEVLTLNEMSREPLVGHNFKFDLLHLWNKGVKLSADDWLADTQLMAYVYTNKVTDDYLANYNAELPKGLRKGTPHSLKTLAPYFLGVEPYWETKGHDSEEYVLKDVEYTGLLYIELKRRLEELGQYSFYHEKQLPWTKMLLEAEHRGVQLDMDLLVQKEAELTAKAATFIPKLHEEWKDAHHSYHKEQQQAVYEKYKDMCVKASLKAKDKDKTFERYQKLAEQALRKVPTKINYESPKQMAWLLRDYFGYDITITKWNKEKRKQEKKESTGIEVLERLVDQGATDVKTYLEWRRTNKILTSFIPTYKELAIREEDGSYTLHPIFNPDSTLTGRTSSERPNFQQVPPALRTLTRARDGYCFIGYDAGAIEAKLIAAYTQDPVLYEIISTGVSFHDFNTKDWLDLDAPIDEVKILHPIERSATKNVGFALFYNAQKNRIKSAYAQKGIHLTDDQAYLIHQRFCERYTVAKTVADEIVSYMEEGNVFENLLGRPLKMQNPDDAFMKAFNKVIQSSASDLNLEGAKRANEEFKRLNIEAYPILFVHDFVCFEVKKEHAVEADEILTSCLTDFELTTSNGPILLTIEGGITERWEK